LAACINIWFTSKIGIELTRELVERTAIILNIPRIVGTLYSHGGGNQIRPIFCNRNPPAPSRSAKLARNSPARSGKTLVRSRV